MSIAFLFLIAIVAVGFIVFHRNPPPRVWDSVSVMQGDITQEGFDCIVNAANRFGIGGGGVDGAIHRAAGPELKEHCRSLACWETTTPEGVVEYIRIFPGQAITTPGFGLCETIVHTVGPIYDPEKEQECYDTLCKAYQNSIEAAVAAGHKEVAFPLISTGVYGYPLADAISVAVITCGIHGMLNDVHCVLVAFDKDTFEAVDKELKFFKENL